MWKALKFTSHCMLFVLRGWVWTLAHFTLNWNREKNNHWHIKKKPCWLLDSLFIYCNFQLALSSRFLQNIAFLMDRAFNHTFLPSSKQTAKQLLATKHFLSIFRLSQWGDFSVFPFSFHHWAIIAGSCPGQQKQRFKHSLKRGNFCRLGYTQHQMSDCWGAYFVGNGELCPLSPADHALAPSFRGAGQSLSSGPWALVLKARMLAAKQHAPRGQGPDQAENDAARATWCNVLSASVWPSSLTIVLSTLVHFC